MKWTAVSLVLCRPQKNHQSGLVDAKDETDANIFSFPVPEKYPGKTIKNNLSHLNPTSDDLFQRSRDSESAKFKSSASCWIETKICTALLSPGAHFRTLLTRTLLILFLNSVCTAGSQNLVQFTAPPFILMADSLCNEWKFRCKFPQTLENKGVQLLLPPTK